MLGCLQSCGVLDMETNVDGSSVIHKLYYILHFDKYGRTTLDSPSPSISVFTCPCRRKCPCLWLHVHTPIRSLGHGRWAQPPESPVVWNISRAPLPSCCQTQTLKSNERDELLRWVSRESQTVVLARGTTKPYTSHAHREEEVTLCLHAQCRVCE